MIICSQSSKLSIMGKCSFIHFIEALKSKENLMILFCILCLNLFGCCVGRLNVTKHFIYSIYCLAALPARSHVPSKRGHVSPKTCLTGLHYISHLMDGDFSNPGYLQGILSSNWATHQLSFSFCHTDFINQEDVIEHMESCSETDPEANRSLLPANT